MKKYSRAALVLAAVCLAVFLITATAPAASATLSAFEEIHLDGRTEKYIDDATTQDLGGNGNPIGYVAGYGCGNSSLNDIVYFEDVDFGSTGAMAITLLFGFDNKNGETTDLNFYIDGYDPKNLVGQAQVGDTGGWSIIDAKEVTFPVIIPAGVHSVYIQFTTANSGSFSYIRFGTVYDPGDAQVPAEYSGPPLEDSAAVNIFADELFSAGIALIHDTPDLVIDVGFYLIAIALHMAIIPAKEDLILALVVAYRSHLFRHAVFRDHIAGIACRDLEII